MYILNGRAVRKYLIYDMKIISKIILFSYKVFVYCGILQMDNKKIEALVSHKHKIVFLLNPKVASRSLIDYFLYEPSFTVVESNIGNLEKIYGDYFWYCTFRHPVSRVKSCYKQKIATDDPVIAARIWSHYGGALHSGLSFEAFVSFLATSAGRDERSDRHWMSQVRVLGINEDINVFSKFKKVFLFEELEMLPKYFATNHNMGNRKMKKILATASGDVEIDGRSAALLKARYASDFDTYNKIKLGEVL